VKRVWTVVCYSEEFEREGMTHRAMPVDMREGGVPFSSTVIGMFGVMPLRNAVLLGS
jgi:hypothetical protein